MPDDKGMLGDLEFENQITELGDNLPELVKFVARQQFSTSKILIIHDKRIAKLEYRDRKFMGTIGGIGGIIGAGIASAINYFLGRS